MEITRILAPNPGPFTGPGTNTYVICNGEHAALLDPGPIIPEHLSAIEQAVGELTPVGVIVTHNHSDHAPMANMLAERLGVAAFGYEAGPDFTPDVLISDGDSIPIGARELIAVHTPGHTADHLCFLAGQQLFTGDHIMGGSTVVIEDATAYMASLYRVAALGVDRLCPGHGDLIDDAGDAVAAYIEHRLERERQIIAAVEGGAGSVPQIVDAVYEEIDPVLIPAACFQVEVQLEKLISENRLFLDPTATVDTRVVAPD